MSNAALLGQEWAALQNNFEHYELWGLLLKVVALVLVLVAFALHLSALRLGGVLLLLWVQEAILRTFQARLGQRLLQVEAMVKHALTAPAVAGGAEVPFQLHSAWLAARPRGLALIIEYARNACRPTVFFPYGLLLAGLGVRAAM